jgi:fermentation-respiration switch protein FrsA (DUF1100 family)
MKEKQMKRMTTGLIALAIAYLTLVVVMAVFQRQLMYFPDKQLGPPAQYGLVGFSDDFITSADGVRVQLWHKAAQTGMPTIVYFHGNASHIGNRAGIYSALARKGFGVVALSYRGYGKSEGSPSEVGLYNDARAALNYVANDLNIPLSQTMIYGESLGTGVSVQVATEYKVAGLVLQAPYTSVVGRAAEIYFYVPVHLLIHDKYNSLSKIANVHSPLLILHGELDETIPIAHGKTLFAAANEPKEAVYFPDIAHNNFDSSAVAERVLKFARAQGIVSAP